MILTLLCIVHGLETAATSQAVINIPLQVINNY